VRPGVAANESERHVGQKKEKRAPRRSWRTCWRSGLRSTCLYGSDEKRKKRAATHFQLFEHTHVTWTNGQGEPRSAQPQVLTEIHIRRPGIDVVDGIQSAVAAIRPKCLDALRAPRVQSGRTLRWAHARTYHRFFPTTEGAELETIYGNWRNVTRLV